MKWAVFTMPRCPSPGIIVEPRTFVIEADGEIGVVAAMKESYPGHMILGVAPLKSVSWVREE